LRFRGFVFALLALRRAHQNAEKRNWFRSAFFTVIVAKARFLLAGSIFCKCNFQTRFAP